MRLTFLPLIAACGGGEEPPIPVAPVPATPEWTSHVQAAVDEWISWCPGALVVDVAGHEVRLVSSAEWYGADGAVGELVVTSPPWSILIRDGRSREATHRTLLHELGHVLIGRDHVDGILSERTVEGQRLTAADADLACP